MKKTIAILLSFICINAFTQETPVNKNVMVKWAPTGLILGSLSFQGEYSIGGKSSLTAKIGIPVGSKHSFEYEGDDAEFTLKATSFLAGYRVYTSQKHMRGFYFEPFFKYVHHTGEGAANSMLNNRPVRMNFTNDYNGVGIGAQLGLQFMIGKRVVLDWFFLGPEINTASNKFKSIEATSTIAWTQIEATEAEQDIRDFIDQFPFIRNKTKVVVDPNNRSVMANFRGALPGLRTGISIGVNL
jgi:hypothetical protein